MTRPQSSRATRRRRAPEPLEPHEISSEREGGLFAVLKMLVAALLAARLLVPPEAAVFGDSLWIVELWFVAGIVWGWDAWRRADGRLRFDALDSAVWAVVAGHVVSALWTFQIGGDRRAALNLMWEWVALGTSFFLLRQVLRRGGDLRRLLVATLGLAIALAGLGIWQHYIWLPQACDRYETIVSEIAELNAAADLTAAEALARHERRIALQQELVDMQVPADPQGRRLFEDRLRSTEPFGLFALANTFAAVLLAWLVVGAALAVRLWKRGGSRAAAAGFTLALAPVAYCLILTKSRTAWTGLIAAAAAWGWLALRHGRPSSATAGSTEGELPRRVPWAASAGFAVLLIAAMLFVATLSGGFDRQVVSEAPKSLSYRLQYWVGAADVVREHPVFGVGPGNFRQHYLKHKLPQSSEAIAEPHNFVLDLWTSGGFLAVAGIAVLVVVAGAKIRRASADDSRAAQGSTGPAPHDDGRSLISDPLVWGTGLASLVVLGGRFALGAPPDEQLLALAGVWTVLMAFASVALRGRAVALPVAGIAAACVGVLVHLLGAGGMEMPAIPQMLLVLLALASGPFPAEGQPELRNSLRAAVLAGVAMVVLWVMCWLTAAGPVFNRQTLVAAGEAALRADRNPEKARRLFAEAAERDPLSPDPPRQLAELAFARWQASAGLDSAEFERGMELLRLSLEADPHNWAGYSNLGLWSLSRFRRSGDPADAARATDALSQAVERYPTSARLRGELSVALAAANRTEAARRHAARALELDEINRREGHRDKYLAEEQRTELRRLAGP